MWERDQRPGISFCVKNIPALIRKAVGVYHFLVRQHVLSGGDMVRTLRPVILLLLVLLPPQAMPRYAAGLYQWDLRRGGGI
jgi:hypothetical protein